jgi:drug/metabolite transporter (DMT)-like permease
MSVPIALPAALAYGVADFAGGIASRRAPVLAVTAGVQVVGLIALVPVVFVVGGAPSVAAFVLGALGGLAGAAGLLLYLRGLAVGPMGVVAPLSAVVGAGLPLLIGIAWGERPTVLTLFAIAVALVAILLASAGTPRGGGGRTGPLLALGAGAGFALFFVALDATPADSALWPLLAGRLTTAPLLTLLALTLLHRESTDPARRDRRSGTRSIGTLGVLDRSTRAGVGRLVVLSGVFDTGANVLFLLATRSGDLGVSAVVVSLYPVVVVLLARFVLGERLTGMQISSAGLALGASVLLAVGS